MSNGIIFKSISVFLMGFSAIFVLMSVYAFGKLRGYKQAVRDIQNIFQNRMDNNSLNMIRGQQYENNYSRWKRF